MEQRIDRRDAFVGGMVLLMKKFLQESGYVGEHFQDTPERWGKALLEMVADASPEAVSALPELTAFDSNASDSRLAVTSGPLYFSALCPHHLLPYVGRAYLSYVPNGTIVGLSKIPRLLDALSRQPMTQEALAQKLADTLSQAIGPRWIGTAFDAMHTCMCARGVGAFSFTRTVYLTGGATNLEHRQQFLATLPPLPYNV